MKSNTNKSALLSAADYLAYFTACSANLPEDFGDGWMTKGAIDLVKIATIARFDIKELTRRLFVIGCKRPRSVRLNALTVGNIMADMSDEEEARNKEGKK